MPKSYYSTVFKQPADVVWSVIRDFNNYAVWVGGKSEIEGGKAGDTVGAIRNVLYNGNRRRQKLLALSGVERTQTYAFEGEIPLPVKNFQATLHITPMMDGIRAFVEWWTTFDCELDKRDERIAFFRNAFAGWLESLTRHMARQQAA
jgi:hypothetical protein